MHSNVSVWSDYNEEIFEVVWLYLFATHLTMGMHEGSRMHLLREYSLRLLVLLRKQKHPPLAFRATLICSYQARDSRRCLEVPAYCFHAFRCMLSPVWVLAEDHIVSSYLHLQGSQRAGSTRPRRPCQSLQRSSHRLDQLVATRRRLAGGREGPLPPLLRPSG